MKKNDGFYTMTGYRLNETEPLTAAMEDYLEMICRMLKTSDVVRVSALAQQLHVKPSSASKMVANLREAGYVESKKYGYVSATPKGRRVGGKLLHRHDVLHRFFRLLNHSENELEQVEKIEHFINPDTIQNIEALCAWMETRPLEDTDAE